MGNQPSSTNKESPSCPVKHDAKIEGCPVKHGAANGCPVKKGPVYNVYGEEIDPTNMMPSNPNQEPKDGQKFPLETQRVNSTIPKGGVDGTWTYPSEQMFFNAMKRKGKGEDVHEGHVPTIVAIHNNMNERTWRQLLQWEETLHPGSEPRLLRFMGRPDDLTPLARFKSWLGHGLPFDRHDWYIQRKDGETVRYVIDYYYDEDLSTKDETPTLHSAESIKSISMYARPAVDSVASAWDRCRYRFTAPKSVESPEESLDTEESTGEKLNAEQVNARFGRIKEQCAAKLKNVRECSNEIECAQAANALQYCLASVVCPDAAQAFSKALATQDEAKISAKYDEMNACIEKFEAAAQHVLREQAVLDAAGKTI